MTAKKKAVPKSAAALRKRYGSRALSVAFAMKNIAKTPAQRKHWAKLIASMERGQAARKKKIRRIAATRTKVRKLRRNPVKHGYTIIANGAELGTIKARAHALELARGFKAAHPRVKVQVRVP